MGCRVGKGRCTHDTAKEESPVEMDREDGQENKESVGKGRQRREQGNGVSGRREVGRWWLANEQI